MYGEAVVSSMWAIAKGGNAGTMAQWTTICGIVGVVVAVDVIRCVSR